MVKILSKQTLMVEIPSKDPKPGFRWSQYFRTVTEDGVMKVFFTERQIAYRWTQRWIHEVNCGLASEPKLYQPIYNIVTDRSLPRNVSIYRLDPNGLIFNEVTPDGKVTFSRASSGNSTVPIRHYAVGIEYSKELFDFNEFWNVPQIERAAGRGYNALQNHIHLSPFCTGVYPAANQTPYTHRGRNLLERTLHTLEDAIENATHDTEHPRRGPYALLICSADLYTVERAFIAAEKNSLGGKTSVLSKVQSIVVYDGWTGSFGAKNTTYPGVTPGKAYLINLAFREQDHQSYVKQDLQSVLGQTQELEEVIANQIVLESYFGVYVNPAASTEEINLPYAILKEDSILGDEELEELARTAWRIVTGDDLMPERERVGWRAAVIEIQKQLQERL